MVVVVVNADGVVGALADLFTPSILKKRTGILPVYSNCSQSIFFK